MKIGNLVREAMASLKKNYLAVTSVTLVMLVVLVVYWQDLVILFNEALQSEALSHIIIIPFLVSYLIYRKKELVKASSALEKLRGKTTLFQINDFIGVALCLTGLLVYWYGSYTFNPLEYHIVSLIVFIMGVTLILTNVRTVLVLIFPIIFLIFLVPPPSDIVYTAGGILANVNTQGSYNLLKIAGLPVSLSNRLGAPTIALNTTSGITEFAVYQASSGVYSLLAFTTFAIFLIYITHGSLVKKAGLFALGILILPILNIIRISIIVSVAYFFGQAMSDIFHTFSGWLLIFFGISLLIIFGERILHLQIFQSSNAVSSCPECNNPPLSPRVFCSTCGMFLKTQPMKISKKFWTKAIALLISSHLITMSIQAPAFAFSPGLTLSNSNPEESTNAFPKIADYQLQFLYRDVSYQKAAGQDASLIYAYMPRNGSILPVYVLVGVANSISNLHNWEVSLVAWRTAQGLPPLANVIDTKDIQLTENPRIIARYLVFRDPNNYTYVALYWYQKASFRMGLSVEQRYIRINLLFFMWNQPNNLAQLKEKLTNIGQTIVIYWEPLRVQSLFSLGIPIQQVLLGLTVMGAIFVHTSQYAFERRKKGTNLRIFEKFARPNEKLLYQTVKELRQETRETTAENIAFALKKTKGKAAKLNELNNLLRNLEKHGLIKTDIINISDQAKLIWKT